MSDKPKQNDEEQGNAAAEQPRKKRRWFQFHLSTAVAGMLVMGVIYYTGLHVRYFVDGLERKPAFKEQYYGWPYIFCTQYDVSENSGWKRYVSYDRVSLIVDITVWLLILAAACSAVEMLSRRYDQNPL